MVDVLIAVGFFLVLLTFITVWLALWILGCAVVSVLVKWFRR